MELVTLKGTGNVRKIALHKLLGVSSWCLSEFTPDRIENERLRKTLQTLGYHITTLEVIAYIIQAITITSRQQQASRKKGRW